MTRRCPICKNAAPPFPANEFAPFCSDRCKTIDMGNWIDERYRLDEDDAPIPPRTNGHEP